MDLMQCPDLAVPASVMQHVVHVESSFNPYAIGVVGGRLVRQPKNLPEAVATAQMLEARGINFSLGLAQVNRYNLGRYGLASYSAAFQACPNLKAGSRILAECAGRSGGNWGKAFSCYYSGNFETGYKHGYVQKVFASMQADASRYPGAIPLAVTPRARVVAATPRTNAAASARIASTSWSQRIVAPPSVATPVTPSRIAAPPPYTASTAAFATRPAIRPNVAPTRASANDIATQDSVAILDAAGGPPRLVSSSTAPTAPAAPSPAVDTAFVF